MGKKLINAVVIIAMLLSLSGCGMTSIYMNYKRLETLVLIRTIGVDTTEDGVRVTATSGMGIDEAAPEVYSASGETLGAALQNLESSFSLKEAFFAHTEHFLIGEEAARGGVEPYLDYISRSLNMRLGTSMFIVNGTTAEECIRSADSETSAVSDMLSSIEENIEELSLGHVYSCGEIMAELNDTGIALIMGVELTEPENVSPGREETPEVRPAGYAVVRDGRLVCFTDESVTKGASILTKNVKNDTLTVCGPNGGDIDLRITDFAPEMKTSFNEDGLIDSISFQISGKMNIVEMSAWYDLTDRKVLTEIEEIASEEIRGEVLDALQFGEKLGFDYLGLGAMVDMKNPIKFDRMTVPWSEQYPNIQYSAEVKLEIERSYEINSPLKYNGQEEVR